MKFKKGDTAKVNLKSPYFGKVGLVDHIVSDHRDHVHINIDGKILSFWDTDLDKVESSSKIEAYIMNIDVDERYYSFDYLIICDGEEKKGNYSDDYNNDMSVKEWTDTLKEGYALSIAMVREFE